MSVAPLPLWSVTVLTCHRAACLRATLESLIAQDPGPEVTQIGPEDPGRARR